LFFARPLAKPVVFGEEALSAEDCLSAASSAGAKATEPKTTRLKPRGFQKTNPSRESPKPKRQIHLANHML